MCFAEVAGLWWCSLESVVRFRFSVLWTSETFVLRKPTPHEWMWTKTSSCVCIRPTPPWWSPAYKSCLLPSFKIYWCWTVVLTTRKGGQVPLTQQVQRSQLQTILRNLLYLFCTSTLYVYISTLWSAIATSISYSIFRSSYIGLVHVRLSHVIRNHIIQNCEITY